MNCNYFKGRNTNSNSIAAFKLQLTLIIHAHSRHICLTCLALVC